MPKKTIFSTVPLDTVKEIVKEGAKPKKPPQIKPLGKNGANAKGGKVDSLHLW
jgi:hypothetical protein